VSEEVEAPNGGSRLLEDVSRGKGCCRLQGVWVPGPV
jgi:hypothetical protein